MATATTTAFTYDAGDRPTQVIDSVGGTITHTCDNRFDTPATEVAPLGTGTSTLTYSYDASGCRTQIQVTGQSAVTYGYDGAYPAPASRRARKAQWGRILPVAPNKATA